MVNTILNIILISTIIFALSVFPSGFLVKQLQTFPCCHGTVTRVFLSSFWY